MSPVFLVYTFREPLLLGRLVRALAPHRVVIHVDAKVNDADFREATRPYKARVYHLTERHLVNWAGYSQVQAIRSLVRCALERFLQADDDYVVMLSGQDYPIRPVDDLTTHLAASGQRQFLRSFAIAEAGGKYARQVASPHYRDLPVLRRYTRHPAFRRLRNSVVRAIEGGARAAQLHMSPPEGVLPAQGGTHFALTASCVDYLERRVTPEIEHYFARTFCPEEKFYHSLLAGDPGDWNWSLEPFVGPGQWRYANLHHIHRSLVKIYSVADWREVAASDRFFLRKVESGRSGTLLDRIDAELLARSR